MTDSIATDAGELLNPSCRRRFAFWVVCAVVIGLLFLGAGQGISVLKNTEAKDCYYNLLVQGFRAGQLNLKKDVPPGLTRLANPYDPAQNAPYIPEVGDMSFYKGKLYLYYGVAPALVLYWPFVALTGHYLQDAWAGLIFCSIGFMAGALLLYAIWRRYFPQLRTWAGLSGIFIFGLMIVAHESEWLEIRIYEVALCAGFAFVMVALAAIWAALHQPFRRNSWLLLASVSYGLAIASRPSLVLGVVVLLVPIIQAMVYARTSSPQRFSTPLAMKNMAWEIARSFFAVLMPLLVIGTGLMIYNAMRFGSPLELGCRYEVTGTSPATTLGQFNLHFFWFNTRFYFWEPIHWARHLPFLRPAPHWNASPEFGPEQYYGGLLALYPTTVIALAAPLAWRSRVRTDSVQKLRWFVAAVILLFITGALPICLFNVANDRYELDFLPALMVVAVIGIFALETTIFDSAACSRIARWGWRALSVSMLGTSLAVALDTYVTANYFAGNVLVNRGVLAEAIKHFQRALAIEPAYPGSYDGLGNALFQQGHAAEAIVQYNKALKIKPDLVGARYDLGHCYYEIGRIPDAIAQFQIVLNLDPKFAKAQNDLASCYLAEGRIADALAQFQKTVETSPDFADARNNLGYCLLQNGHVSEAVVQFQQAVALEPKSANFRCGLGNALLKMGRDDEAIVQYEKAVELAPEVAGIHYDLAAGLLQAGKLDDAIAQYRQAVALKSNSATYHWGLAGALTKKGLSAEANVQYQKALALDPAFAKRLPAKQ
jgi:tetratricopeptide (TPR) repeat protein